MSTNCDIDRTNDDTVTHLRKVNADLLAALELAIEASTQGISDKSWEDTAIAAIAAARGPA